MQSNPSPKLCECGCGQPAPIAKMTNARKGLVQGQPCRFISGHNSRVHSEETRCKMADAQRALPAETRDAMAEARRGRRVSDEGRRNLSIGAGGTGAAGVKAIHLRLIAHHPKTGVCEECGRNAGASGPAGTHYAFQRHPEPHTDRREDYRELCPSCHVAFDRV